MKAEIKQRIVKIKNGQVPDGYKKTKIGIVPEEWTVCKASEIFKNITDKKHNGDLEVLSATQDKGVIPRSMVDIDIKFDEASVVNYKKVKKGNFVISLRSFQGGIEYSEYEGLVSPAYTVLEETKPINHYFYKTYLKTTDYIQRLAVATYGIRDGKQIGYNDFGFIQIPYPPIEEQEKISKILELQDKIIELQQKKVDEYKKLKKAMLQRMFPKKGEKIPEIRFPAFTDAWEQREFGDLYKRRMERNNGQFDKTRWISVARMYFQEPEKVTSNNINTRTYVMRVGDIAFEGHSNKEYKLGRFVVNDIGGGVVSELFPIFQQIGEYDLYFWKFYIQIENIMFPKLLRCIEISYASSNKLDEKFFLKEKILVPSIAEQKRIGAYFKNLDNLITLHQRKLGEYTTYKRSLIQLVLTGIARIR